MNCVNKKSTEFRKLVSDYNVSENTMELLIHQYWIEKKSEEDFPTKAYINAHLGLTPYEEHIDSVIKVWNKLYSHPLILKNKMEMLEAKKLALKVFPKWAVNVHLDAKGDKYVLTVRKPVKNLKKAHEEMIKEGSFNDISLDLKIEKNKDYSINKIQTLYNTLNTDRTSAKMAEKVFKLANSLGIMTRFTDLDNENLGKYVPGRGVYLNNDFFLNPANSDKKASIILHEFIHAITSYALSDVVRENSMPIALTNFKKSITQIYDSVKDNKALEGERGVTDVREFLAELANPLFRDKLRSIESDDKSIWQRIVIALKRLFNLHSSSDYYTRAMNALNNALYVFDVDTYMEYNGILKELREMQDSNSGHTLSDKAQAFIDSLPEVRVNNIIDTINREVADYRLATGMDKQGNIQHNGYFTFDDGSQVKAPFMPNEQQAKALNEMNKFIHSDETSMTLSGYAGTGKTSLMEMLKHRAWKEGKDVIFTATTNKAAAVLKSKVGGDAMTLNKAFGISVKVNDLSEYDAKNLINDVKEKNSIGYGSIVVIDEASMINEQNYAILNEIAKANGAKIIYVGDSAQLPPVKDKKISKVFRDENGKVVELTQVERTGDNAILREATDVREGKGLSGISSFNKEGKGVAYLRPQQKKEIGDIVRHFIPQIKEDPDNFKIMAYTNEKVALYNEAVRKTLGYNDNTPRVGESIMGYANFDYQYGKYGFINSENYKVVHVAPARKNIIYFKGNTYETLVNDVTIETPEGENKTYAFTDVKQNQHNRQVVYTLGKEVARLWEDYRRTHIKSFLSDINAINKNLFINDDIMEGGRTIVAKTYDFGYAITVHKSQGSTFKNVLIDDVDIQKARQEDEYDAGVPAADYDAVDTNNMVPAGKVAMDDVHDMSGATEVSSASFSLDEEPSASQSVKPKETGNKIQQLEYVAISRATDTATIISDNVKKEGSPLHPEQSIKEDTIKKENQRLNNNTNNIKNGEYKATDGFRRVQEASRKLSQEQISRMRKRLSEDDKRRLGRLLGRQLDTARNGGWYNLRSSLTYTKKNGKVSTFNIGDVNPQLFHDIFEVVRTYLKNGELVDLHDDYNNAKCFITSDGLAGFAIEPDGNLVSVFSLNSKENGGFLYAIKDLVREEGATHLDAYASSNQPLQEIYAKTLGFHTASTMDYNMEYDHDDIAKNHGTPQVVFMVDHEVAEPKHFDKDSYDEAQQYQLSQLGTSQQKQQVESTPNSYEGMITPDKDTIFVFGSNPEGRHGAGAAKTAKDKFGAKYGQGEGLQGNAYALPTKDLRIKENRSLKSISAKQITENIKKMYDVARQNPSKQFKVAYTHDLNKTSLNGYTGAEMIKMFKDAGPIPSNVYFSKNWTDHWDEVKSNTKENATNKENQRLNNNQQLKSEQMTQHINAALSESPIKPSQPKKVSLPGYEHFDRMVKNGEQKGIEVDAEWKIPLLKELDSKIYNPEDEYHALGLIYDEDKWKERLTNEECINKINVLLRRVHSKEEWDNLALRNKLIKEEYEQNQYDKLARQIDNLNNPEDSEDNNLFDTPLTSSEVKHAVEMAMDYASDIITRLQTEGEEYAKEINPDFQSKEGFDFKSASRQAVIEAVGLSNIFEAVHKWFNYNNDWCDTDEALDEAGDKMSFLHDNWDAVMWMGAPFFNFNEGFGFKEQIGGVVERTHEDNQLPHDESFEKANDEDALVELYGEGREHYLVDSRTIDTIDSMSTLVKRAIHECYLLDRDGNPIVNRTWGLKERVNTRDASLNILSWTQGAVTYEDMLAKISQKAKLKKNNWVNQLLIKLNDNSGQYTDLQSQFFSVFCKHRTAYTVGIDKDGKVSSIPANKNPVLKQIMDTAKARFNAGETPLFNSRKINSSLIGNKNSITDRYTFNLNKALHELQTLDKSLDIRVNYQRQRKALTEEQIESASENLAKAMQAVGFNFVKEEVEDILDESTLHSMTNALRIIVDKVTGLNKYMINHPEDKEPFNPFNYASSEGLVGAIKNLIKPITDSLEENTQNTVYDNGKLYQEFTIPSFLTKLFQKFSIQDENKFHEFIAEEYGKSQFFSLGHSFDRHYLREKYNWRLPWLDMMANGNSYRQYFDHRVNLSYKGKCYMKNMSDLDYAMSVLSQYWSMSSKMEDGIQSYFRMPMQSNKPTEDYIGFVANRDKNTYKKDIVEGKSDRLGLYHMFLTELSRIQTVRMRNKSKEDEGFIKNFDTNGRNFCFFKFLNPYLNGLSIEDKHNGYSTDLLAPTEVFGNDGNAIENHDDSKFASLLQKKVKGEVALTSEEELELARLAKEAIYNYLQNRFNGILDSWQENGLIKAARNITNIAESNVSLDNNFNEKNQKAEYDEREKQIDSYVRGQLENFLWNDYFATKNILMLTIGDTSFYKDEEDLQKRLAQLHAPGLRGRVSAIDYNGILVSDGKYRTVILKDFDMVKSNIIANITEIFDRKIAAAPDNMKAQWTALKESVLKAYSEINVADAEGYTSPTAYRKKAIMFSKWSKEAEQTYQKIFKGEDVSFTDIKQAFQPLKPFVYSHLQKTTEVDNAPITNMYCPFQAKNSEYLLVMADAFLRNEKTLRPNLLKAIFDTMEDSAFDGRKRDKDGKILVDGTYNGKGIDTIQFESAIKSSLQGAVDIAKFADDLAEGEKNAKDALHEAIYKAGTEGYNSSAYNTDVFVHELPYEDYCLQQDVPDHFKDHEQAHGSQTRMIIPSDLEEYYDEKVSKDNPDNIVKYEYDEWQETAKDKWEKVHVSKTAKEIKEEYENTIYENIVSSLDNLVKELHLDSPSRVERNLALSKILQRELHSSPRYGIDLIQACTIDKVTGEFRIPKGDPIQCKRIEQLINSIIKNRVNKQLIPGGPIVQVSNFGTSRQLHIRFNDKKGKLLPTREEYDASKHDGKSYEDYCKENQGGIAYFEVFAPIWSEELYHTFADEKGIIDVKAIEKTDPDLLKLITYRIPTEDKCSIAPCKIVGFLPKAAGSTIMLPYELTSQDGSDFDIDKRYVMRKNLSIVRDNSKIADELYKRVNERKPVSEEQAPSVRKDIDNFLSVIGTDHSYTVKYTKGGKQLNNLYNELRKSEEWRKMFTTVRPKGRDMRNNKIIDLSWSVLTNPATADKVLKPEGFDEQKKVGYMIAAYRNNPDISWEELEHIANGEKGIENLKKLSYIEKDLAFFDTQLQFYKQNAAAASLIGVFAVNKIAHSTLEGDGIYLEVPEGTTPFTIGHMIFMKERMELDPRFDTEGNNIGNVLGSLVGASADAVKDPILNLMNINMNTANILNALLRLGMSFKEAAMFLSQSVITKALAECDKQNLEGYASIKNITMNMIKEMNNKNHYTSENKIVTEEISPEELVEGLLEGNHEALDYKVLIAFNKILDLADMLRKPTLVTRFNSIAGAVGPLAIDNIMTEAKLADFTSNNGGSTGFEYQDKTGEWQPVTFSTILGMHPILAGFYSTYGLANNMFSDNPAGSAGFSKVVNSLGMLGGKVLKNRQLLNSLVNFYSSFLLVDSGLMNANKLEYYIKEFPMEFNRIKDSEKYRDNALVKAIFLKENSRSSVPSLQLNITGLDTISKEKLSSAWIDLYKENKELALKLFAYNVFRGGLEFSPKTFISLLPNYIKERISRTLPDGKKVSYLDVFRKLNLSKVDPKIVVDQFVRNNWDNNSLVPYVKLTKEMTYSDGILSVVSNEDKNRVQGNQYIKTKVGNNLLLLKYDDNDGKVMIYKSVEPLGNHGEYMEIADHAIVKAMPITNKNDTEVVENIQVENSQLSADNLIDDGTMAFMEADFVQENAQEESRKALTLAEMFMAYNSKYDKRKANEIIGNYKRNIEQYGKLFGPQYDLLRGVFEKQGLKLNDKQLIEKFKELC